MIGQMSLFDFINRQVTCKIDKSFQCNHAEAKKVAISCGENCKQDCCLACKEQCGARCNPSAHLQKPRFTKKTCAATLEECNCYCGTDSSTDKCCQNCIKQCENRCNYSLDRYEVFDRENKEWIKNPNYFNPVWETVLKGTGFRNGKERVQSYFTENHTQSERVRFLKDEFGIGGFGIPHKGKTNFVHGSLSDGKGLKIEYLDSVGENHEELIPWSKVEKEISFLISKGWYMDNRKM